MSQIGKIVGMNPRTKRKVEKVMSAIRLCGYIEQISARDLDEIIIRVVGQDVRTVKTMKRLLVMDRKIAAVNQYVYQLLPEDLATLDDFDVGEVKLERKE